MSRPARTPGAFEQLALREKILLSLLAVGAVVEDLVADAFVPITIGRAVDQLFSPDDAYLEYRRKTRQNTLALLLKKKFIEAVEKNRPQKSFRLTRDGLDLLFRKFPKLKYGGRPWDGYWRVVVYDIAEKESKLRSRLRTELCHLGYKFIQKSVWLSPFPTEEELKEFLRKESLWGKILVFKAVLPPEETQRFSSLFYREPGKTGPKIQAHPTSDQLVSRLLTNPPLPKGLSPSSRI